MYRVALTTVVRKARASGAASSKSNTGPPFFTTYVTWEAGPPVGRAGVSACGGPGFPGTRYSSFP